MRYLTKLPEPEVLTTNGPTWLAEWKADKTNTYRKYRYRHPDIKAQLKNETGNKCIYCESKIGHNTPGDTEHIIPSSKNEDTHFSWDNLTISCTECNRRKNNYYEEGEEFLNPYIDEDIENVLIHMGPIISWIPGNARAEISVKILDLNNGRIELMLKKIEKIEAINALFERYVGEVNPSLRKIQELELFEMADKSSEFSGMAKTILLQKGIPF